MKGIEPLPVETVETLSAALLCGDEVAALSEP